MKSFTFIALFLFNFYLALSQSLVRVSPSYDLASVVDITIHPSGLGFMAQECGQLLKTTDHGRSWTFYRNDLPADAYFNKIIFLDNLDDGAALYLSQYGVYRTTDGFNTWLNISPVSFSGLLNDFAQLSNGRWIVAGGSVATSDDQGATWTANPDTDLSGSVVFEHSGFVYTGYKEIMRSADGLTFEKVFDLSAPLRKFVTMGDKIIAATLDKLFQSTDNGLTWSMIDAVDYYGYSDNLSVSGDTLIANSSNRINYSADGGLKWESIVMPEGIYRTNRLCINAFKEIIIGGEDSQVYFTPAIDVPLQPIYGSKVFLNDVAVKDGMFYCTGSDGMLIKGRVDGSGSTAYTFDQGNDLIEVLGSNIVFSDNKGDVSIFDPNTNTKNVVLSTNSYVSNILYSKVDQLSYLIARKMIYKSEDKGFSWTAVHTFDADAYGLSSDQFGNIYVMTEDQKVWWSANGAIDWEELFDGPFTGSLQDLYVHDDDRIYVLTSTALYYSNDKGLNFSQQPRPYNGVKLYRLSDEELICLGVNSSDTWIYSGKVGGILSSIGKSCATNSRFACVDEANRTLYLCGATQGVEKFQFETTAIFNENSKDSFDNIYSPNPGFGMYQSNLNFPLDDVHVMVYDYSGRLLLRVSNGNPHLDLSMWNSGIYFVHVIANGKNYFQKLVKI